MNVNELIQRLEEAKLDGTEPVTVIPHTNDQRFEIETVINADDSTPSVVIVLKPTV